MKKVLIVLCIGCIALNLLLFNDNVVIGVNNVLAEETEVIPSTKAIIEEYADWDEWTTDYEWDQGNYGYEDPWCNYYTNFDYYDRVDCIEVPDGELVECDLGSFIPCLEWSCYVRELSGFECWNEWSCNEMCEDIINIVPEEDKCSY